MHYVPYMVLQLLFDGVFSILFSLWDFGNADRLFCLLCTLIAKNIVFNHIDILVL
jgi:hypothetical protein